MATDDKARRILSEIAVDLLVLGVQIRNGQVELPACEALRRRVTLLFESAEERGMRAGASHGDIEDVRYALAAYLDEMIQYSEWGGKQEWAQRPLQALLFGDVRAGVHFFERLERLRERRSPALEVYCTCLALGYQGQYRLAGADLDRLTTELTREIGGSSRAISVHGKRPGARGRSRRELPLLPVATVALSLALLLVLVLYGILAWQSSSAVDVLQQMVRR